jgi:hypothetical protein
MNKKRKNIPIDEILKKLSERYEDMTDEEKIQIENIVKESNERLRLMMERHDKQIADYYVRRIKSGADAMHYLKKFQLKK